MSKRYIVWSDGAFLGWNLAFLRPSSPVWFLGTLWGVIREQGWPEQWFARVA